MCRPADMVQVPRVAEGGNPCAGPKGTAIINSPFSIQPLDIPQKCDKLIQLNALTELSLLRGHEREGTVRALGKADGQATPERPARAGRPIPVTG